MKMILLLHDKSTPPKPRLQNVAGSKVIQGQSKGTLGCNCDRWGHPFPDPYPGEPSGSSADSSHKRDN